MFLARITFDTDDDSSRERDVLSSAAESYLAALSKNGQISGEYLFAWSSGTLTAYTYVARPDALAERHHSEWAMSDLHSVIEASGQTPKCEIIDDDVPKRFASWGGCASMSRLRPQMAFVRNCHRSTTVLPIQLSL